MRRLAAALGALALAGCGVTVHSGTVVDRYYSEPYTWFLSQMSCVNNVCTSYLIPIYEPEHWVITLENCDLREEPDDDCPATRWNVDPFTWDDLAIGDHYEVPE